MLKINMNQMVMAAFVMAATPLLAVSAHVHAQTTGGGRYIVTFKKSLDSQSAAQLMGVGAEPVKKLSLVKGYVVTAPTAEVVNKLKHLPNVEKVETDAVAHVAAAPVREQVVVSQPVQTLPWGVDRIDAEKTWALSRGNGVKVAVVDTGIDKTHPDLTANIAGGVNFVKSGKGARVTVDPTAWNDDNGHGTHVSGTIAAADNAIGVIGVAPEARLFGVKVLDSSGNGYVSDIISGIEWSVNNGMQVISMSLSTSSDVQALHDAVDAADNAGIVIVAAAGNVGDGSALTNEVRWPAKYPSVIAVAATDSSDRIASFSSDGEEVELAAPGVNVYSSTRGGGYGTMSGTSMATPHVSGVVADVLAAPVVPAADLNQDGRWSAAEVRAYLQSSSDDLGASGRDRFFGYGLVDAEEVVTGLQTQ